jgi:hypothetical protein
MVGIYCVAPSRWRRGVLNEIVYFGLDLDQLSEAYLEALHWAGCI